VVIPYTRFRTTYLSQKVSKCRQGIATKRCVQTQKSADLLTSRREYEIAIWTLLKVMVCPFIQPQFVSFISFWVAYFRKCFKTPFTISVGACELPEYYFFASRVVGCDRKEHKKMCTVRPGRDTVDLRCPLATTCGEIIQILSKTWMYQCSWTLFGCPYSYRTCSDGFHQRSYEMESRAYNWHISAPKRENWKVLVLVCVVQIRFDNVWCWLCVNQYIEACLNVVFRTLFVLMCAR